MYVILNLHIYECTRRTHNNTFYQHATNDKDFEPLNERNVLTRPLNERNILSNNIVTDCPERKTDRLVMSYDEKLLKEVIEEDKIDEKRITKFCNICYDSNTFMFFLPFRELQHR